VNRIASSGLPFLITGADLLASVLVGSGGPVLGFFRPGRGRASRSGDGRSSLPVRVEAFKDGARRRGRATRRTSLLHPVGEQHCR